MTTTRTHPPEEEAAIRYRRKQWNKTAKVPLTAGQYADMRVAEFFQGLTAQVNAERETVELQAAFKAASPAVQSTVRSQLGIVEP